MEEIVVGVDGSTDAERALRWAVQESRLRDARVRAVLVWASAGPQHEESKPPPATSPEHPRWTAYWLVNDLVERVLRTDPTAPITSDVAFGPPVGTLLAESAGAEMLVLGARGASPARRMLAGSVSLACVHGAEIPVVVVHGEQEHAVRAGPVLVGVDGSPASIDALRWAADEAALRGAPLKVVHVWRPPPPLPSSRVAIGEDVFRDAARAVLDESVSAGLATRTGLDVTTELVQGGPTATLVKLAGSAQLLVVGARGRGGFPELLLGSTSAQCVAHSPCPVAVIRGYTAQRRRAREETATAEVSGAFQ